MSTRTAEGAGRRTIRAVASIPSRCGIRTSIGVLALSWRAGPPRAAAVLLLLFPVADLTMPGHLGTVLAHGIQLVPLTWTNLAMRGCREPAPAGVPPRVPAS